MRDSKVGVVVFVAVGCDSDTVGLFVGYSRFLFENIGGSINGGCRGGLAADMRSECRSFDGWRNSGEERFQK